METSVNAQTGRSKRQRWLSFLSLLVLVGMGALYMVGRMTPTGLGVRDGKLAACPDSPNCVSTQASDEQHRIEPLRLTVDLETATEAARKAILAIPRSKFIHQEKNYCHVTCTSLIFRYIDDFEVFIDEENGLIQARSASRVGYSDMGVNRKRVEDFFSALVAAKVATRQ